MRAKWNRARLPRPGLVLPDQTIHAKTMPVQKNPGLAQYGKILPRNSLPPKA